MTSKHGGPQRADYAPFAHLTAPNSALYRLVMGVFLTAKERFAVHLRPEDVHAALPMESRPAEIETVVKALDSLVEAGAICGPIRTPRVSPRSRTSTASGSSTNSPRPERPPRGPWPPMTRRSGGAGRCRPSHCTTSSRSFGHSC